MLLKDQTLPIVTKLCHFSNFNFRSDKRLQTKLKLACTFRIDFVFNVFNGFGLIDFNLVLFHS